MIYGCTPFQHIGGGPLPKMNVIADPNHRIDYPSEAVTRPMPTINVPAPQPFTVSVPPAAVSAIRGCLEYNKDKRLSIQQLLDHEFLQPNPSNCAYQGEIY